MQIFHPIALTPCMFCGAVPKADDINMSLAQMGSCTSENGLPTRTTGPPRGFTVVSYYSDEEASRGRL